MSILARSYPGAAALLAAALLAAASPAAAQTIRVTAETENLRAAPRGEVIAVLEQGATLAEAERDGGWYRATLRGWIWGASVASAGRANRLSVAVDGGENLRATPNGVVLARVNPGTVLIELERRERWIRVERRASIWAASVEATNATGSARPPASSAAEPSPAGVPSADAEAANGATESASRAPGSARPASATGQAAAGSAGIALLHSPDGDTLGRLRPMTTMEVVATEGNWSRVRVEGWVWQPGLASAADTGTVLRELSAAVLAANPENFRGRIVEWRLQFISLERAERIRTDFYEGEPFILARGPGDENAFVYVAVPPDRVTQVEQLGPLERIVVLARVRTGRSRIMGAPVLDLIELRRE